MPLFSPPIHPWHPPPAQLPPSPCAAQPPPAPEVPTSPTHSKPPGPRWPPAAAGRLPAAPQGCTTAGTSALQDKTNHRHHPVSRVAGITLAALRPRACRQQSGSMMAQVARCGHFLSSRMGAGPPQNTTHYPCQDLPGLQPGTHLDWAGPHPHPALPAPTACSRRGSPSRPCQGLLEEGRGEWLSPRGWA